MSLFALSNTSFSKHSSDKACLLGAFIMEANEKRRSTGADDVKPVLNFRNSFKIRGKLCKA